MKRALVPAILTLLTLLQIGCATRVPSSLAWRPWNRALGEEQAITAGATVSIEVAGQTSPLIGPEALLEQEIAGRLAWLLERRGYTVVDTSSSFTFYLDYSTEAVEKVVYSSAMSSVHQSYAKSETASGAGATGGLGVAIAATLSSLATSSATSYRQAGGSYTIFRHTLAIEVSNSTGEPIWKTDCQWEMNSADILERLTPALQIVLSRLPSTPDIDPEVRMVKKSHTDEYIELICANRTFACPALPNLIEFGESYSYGYKWDTDIEDSCAFEAYVDLIQTAEYALPMGYESWDDPLDEALWSDARLGAKYRLMPHGEEVFVLVDLRGTRDNYKVDRCRTVTAAEFADFSRWIDKWRERLREYYSVYGPCEDTID